MSLPRADGERVRFCMNCNEVVPFGVRVCTACGQFEPSSDDEAGPRRDCQACGRKVPAARVLCRYCGRETGLVPMPREVRPLAGRGTPTAAWAWPGRAAAVLAFVGPLLLLAAVVATLV